MVERLQQALRQPWLQRLFVTYADDLMAVHGCARSIPSILRRDLGFFAQLDGAFKRADALTHIALAERLGPDPLWRHKRAVGSLIRHNVIESLRDPEVQWALLPWRLKRMRAPLVGTWMEPIFQAFLSDMHRERRLYESRGHKRTRAPLQPRSFKCALLGAANLLQIADRAGAQSATQITPHLLDRAIAKGSLPRQRFSRFVRFLNERTKRFGCLKVECAGSPLSKQALRKTRFDQVIAMLLRPESHRDLRASLITLLCLLYAQPAYRAVALSRDRTRFVQGGWQIRPAEHWLALPAEVDALMSRWMGARREAAMLEQRNASPFVFPGRRVGESFTTDALHAWLADRDLKPQMLFPSAMANLCRNGLTHASVATKAYGVSHGTACQYIQFYSASCASKLVRILEGQGQSSRKSSLGEPP